MEEASTKGALLTSQKQELVIRLNESHETSYETNILIIQQLFKIKTNKWTKNKFKSLMFCWNKFRFVETVNKLQKEVEGFTEKYDAKVTKHEQVWTIYLYNNICNNFNIYTLEIGLI